MRVFQTTSIIAVFGCLVTLAGARVPKSHDDGSAKADMAVRTPAGTHTLDRGRHLLHSRLDCCATEITGPGQGHVTDATKFYDLDHNELDVTLAEGTKDVAAAREEPSVPDAEDKSLRLALKAPRAPSKETPICCTPGCLACTTEVCDKGPCTASIFFAACCATQIIVPHAKFYDPDHSELNVTHAEFFAMVEARAQGAHN
ncbi:hypothetical protein QBC37DRAFT_448826 [Rhypophila decipiens]|uniref:Uncharacterized protein n=1 Tax=Rhypophila decipiens TaxID=261697 RepID=A0AAN7BB87_9PEZI|nr:hypothetical protein QBC37DRAFT_448826 [Rhypophila decipiens]